MSSASDFLLDDSVYEDVRAGWNAKLFASSQKLSGLVPFVELYAVFTTDDSIFRNPQRFSQVASRAIDVQFRYTRGESADSATEFQQRFDIPSLAKIVPIASTAKAQTENDTLNESSYRGAAGINDLAVTRGASGPMNIKYSMNMTMPNPEVINEMYEYSKLMILNSTFLLVYGWNPFGFDGIKGANITPPPRLINATSTQGGITPNVVELNKSNGGFYKSSLVRLNRFNFSLDNVGHLGGQMVFLTMAGNFLSATRADAIGAQTKKLLNGYSGMLFSAGSVDSQSIAQQGQDLQEESDNWIELATGWLEESEAYAFAWQKDMERRKAAWDDNNSMNRGPYYPEIGPPFRSTNKWRVSTLRTPDGQPSTKTFNGQEGKYKDFNDRHLQDGYRGSASQGEMRGVTVPVAAELRMDPYGQGSGYYAGSKDEINRFNRFTGKVPAAGASVPREYDPTKDPLLFYEVSEAVLADLDEKQTGFAWAPYMVEWQDAGIGPDPTTHAGFFGTSSGLHPPTRIKQPQDPGYIGDLLNNENMIEDKENARAIWEAEPDHEATAAGFGYFPKEVQETREVQTQQGTTESVPTGATVIKYEPGEGAKTAEYEEAFLKWFGLMVYDRFIDLGPRGNIYGVRPQFGTELLKTIPYAKWLLSYWQKEKSDKLGFMNIENGLPWAMPSSIPKTAFNDYLQQYAEENENGRSVTPDPTLLDTMPAYGRDLMHSIWDSFMEPDNPNRATFFPVDPDSSTTQNTRNQLGFRHVPSLTQTQEPPVPPNPYIEFLDPETVKVMSNSCAISTMMLDTTVPNEESEVSDAESWEVIHAEFEPMEGESPQEQAERLQEEGERFRELSSGSSGVEIGINEDVGTHLKNLATFEHNLEGVESGEEWPEDSSQAGRSVEMIAHAHPVFYFLGAVLEALKVSMNDKVKFMYADIPLEGNLSSGFPLPIPKINADATKQYKEQVGTAQKEFDEWVKGYQDIDRRHPDAIKRYGQEDFPNYGGNKTGKRADELEGAGYRYPYSEDNLTVIKDGNGDIISIKDADDLSWMPDPENPENLLKRIRKDYDKGGSLWNRAISTEEFERQSALREDKLNDIKELNNLMIKNSENILQPLMCKNVFELPVEIPAVRQILNEGGAPLHSIINKILKACNKTTKTIMLSTRPYAGDETYLEIFVANLRVDGVISEVFDDLDIHGFLQGSAVRDQIISEEGGMSVSQFNIAAGLGGAAKEATPGEIAAARNAALGAYFSTKAIVCEFGSERSLVESFNLSSKVDPLAFASFRLPSVIGGQSIDIAKLVRGDLQNESMGFMNDIRDILEKGMYSGKEQLRDLQIIGQTSLSGRTLVNTDALRMFLQADSPAASKIQTTFLTNLMASDQEFNTKIIAEQNEAITGSGSSNNPGNNSFYGGVLSSYLRSISLTVHGVVGLGMFNVVYIKGRMRGIEGLYLITTVNESITPAAFSTSLECKLIQYKNTRDNPLAENLNITLADAAEAARGTGFTDFQVLFDQTEQKLNEEKNQGMLSYE